MKFTVYKKGVLAYLPVTILYNLVFCIAIIITSLDPQKEAKYVMIFSIVAVILLNVMLFTRYQILLSSVVFEKDAVKCTFLKRKRRIIAYNEIKDYGVFWEASIKFIFISKIELSEFQREEKAFELYKKTKNVIVLQYHDKVINFLDSISQKQT